MLQHAVPPAVNPRERLRSTLRQILLFIAVASVIVACYGIAIEPHPLDSNSIGEIAITVLMLCIPAGLLFWIVYRILRFALGRA